MVIYKTVVLIICTYALRTNQSKYHFLFSVCSHFQQCEKQLTATLKECDEIGQLEEPMALRNVMRIEYYPIDKSSCGLELKSKYKAIKTQIRINKKNTSKCIKNGVHDSSKTLNYEKVKFCSKYLTSSLNDLINTTNKCPLKVKIIENRCHALQQCCDPALRCEQYSRYSHSGRTVQGMKEEITIKLAECKEREITTSMSKKSIPVAWTPGLSRESELVSKAPRIFHNSLCTRYLKCRKDILEMKNQCSALIGLPTSGTSYNWAISYNHIAQPLDEKDRDCKNKYSKQLLSLQEKRIKVEQHLRECVQLVNITREPIIKQSVCRKLLNAEDFSASKLRKEWCLKDIAKKKKQCLDLRKCCVQADICERSAMYAMLSDDYLFALTETTDAMNNCYHRH